MKRTVAVVVALMMFNAMQMLVGVAAPARSAEVPTVLEPWAAWVMYGQEEQRCPAHFDDGTQRRCWWPSQLIMNADEEGGLFELQVSVYAPSWVALPGDRNHWPESVSDTEQAIPVGGPDQRPAVWLEPGDYQIRGIFLWKRLPAWIQLPAAVGVVNLTVAGKEVLVPELDAEGRLRLHGKSDANRPEDALSATLSRLIEDDIPMRITTRILLQIAGRDREIHLPHLIPDGATLMGIDSPLPARFADGGDFVVQGKPGRWDIRLTVRQDGPVDRLSIGKAPYGDEIWSFRAYNDLRMVKISGAPSIEPSRTEMPDEWKDYPAYQMQPSSTLVFETIRRGDPDPAPDQLNLERTWWLDFDGTGFTLHDRITGTLSRTWHLAMNRPVELGRVAVAGKDQLITRQKGGSLPGVQLRHGRLDVGADSRMPRQGVGLPAVGWDHDFQQVTGVLHLPPGWRLFSAAGVDVPPGTWLQQWTLLDFFLVLIIAISTYQIRNRLSGLLALVTLTLIFHEPGAPKLVWLHLLAVAALLKYLPDGWFRKLVMAWGAGAVVTLAVVALPFMVQQVRSAIYPQLSHGGDIAPPQLSPMQSSMVLDEQRAPVPQSTVMGKAMRRSADKELAMDSGPTDRPARFAPEPDALIQTGPGLPTWRWQAMPLRWNGPVDQHQQIRLWLLSPTINLVLGLARALLLALLILIFLDLRHWRRHLPAPVTTVAAVTALLLMVPVGLLRAETSPEAFPPQHLLDELRQRLIEPPACLPHCADISRLEMTTTPDQLRLLMQAHAQVDTAVPLPAAAENWRPAQLMIDNEPVHSLARDDHGNLWMVVPRGVHRIKITGPLGSADEIRIGFPLLPRQASFAGVGWQAQGFRPDGGMEAAVVLTRVDRDDTLTAAPPKIDIPAFFEITRTLHLGIQWEVATEIRRLTPPGTPAMLSVPLLPGAAVTTAGIQVIDGMAQIPLGPERMQHRFTATIPISPTIQLTAPQNVPWRESWVLDAGPMWRCVFSGLTVVHHQNRASDWQPQWRPWPGESVSIAVTKPEAVPGRTLTIDSARLDLTPGERFSRSGLTLAIRASKGGRHQIDLPSQANLQAVTIDGKSLPIRQEGRRLDLPIAPGTQTIDVQWLQPNATAMRLSPPPVDVGAAAVNATVTVHMPDHRWILFAGGPRLGPAVLFWSYVVVVLVAGMGLGRIPLTPLRTHHWMLLGLGLTQVPVIFAVIVVAWLLALGYRCNKPFATRTGLFNLGQILLVLLTVAALVVLYTAIEQGLLGIPDMQIAGNRSTALQLNWTQDRINGPMPMPWVISLPQWIYHLLMLLWSLWLAFSLIGWLRWGWRCFSSHQLWCPIQWRRKSKSKSATKDGVTGKNDAPSNKS